MTNYSMKLCVDGKLRVDGRRSKSNRSSFASCQIEWEVVSVALVHYFHAQVGAVQYICPRTNHTTLGVDDGLVEVEAVQVERHRRDT